MHNENHITRIIITGEVTEKEYSTRVQLMTRDSKCNQKPWCLLEGNDANTNMKCKQYKMIIIVAH